MYKSTVLAVLGIFGLSVVAAPFPFNDSTSKAEQTGQGTWFNPGEGACGNYNTDADLIVAISTDFYSSGDYCGKTVTITCTETGVTATAEVADECPGCGTYDLDMSPSLFEEFAGLSIGVIPITWSFD